MQPEFRHFIWFKQEAEPLSLDCFQVDVVLTFWLACAQYMFKTNHLKRPPDEKNIHSFLLCFSFRFNHLLLRPGLPRLEAIIHRRPDACHGYKICPRHNKYSDRRIGNSPIHICYFPRRRNWPWNFCWTFSGHFDRYMENHHWSR